MIDFIEQIKGDLTGTVLGYDPGGNDSHGVALFRYHQGSLADTEISTQRTAAAVIELALTRHDLTAI